MLTFILQPYSRVNTENPYPILDLFPDLLMLTGLRKVVVLPAVPIFKCHLPGNFLRLNFSSNSFNSIQFNSIQFNSIQAIQSQLVRYARICTAKADFLHRLCQVSSRLHRQGFKSAFLLRSLTKFFNRHGAIIGKFDTTLRELRTAVHE